MPSLGGTLWSLAFLHGAWRLRSVCRPRATSGNPWWSWRCCNEPWCLPQRGFWPWKRSLLLALTSLKRIGNLQDLLVASSCLDLAPEVVKVIWHLRPGYVPEVPFVHWLAGHVAGLFSFISWASGAGKIAYFVPGLGHCSSQWHRSIQLLVCLGGSNRSKSITRQHLSHWVVDGIAHAFEAHGTILTRDVPS